MIYDAPSSDYTMMHAQTQNAVVMLKEKAADITPPYAFDEPERFTAQLVMAAERFLSDMKALLEG